MEKQNIKKGLELFCFFLKIGCFTFGGGWSILAQMEQEFVVKRQVISKGDLLDLVAVGKSIPGIMITNIGMLFGYQVAGWFGGVCAVLGLTCPAVIILSAVAWGYNSLKENIWCAYALRGIQAAVVPIIGSAALSLGKDVFSTVRGRVVCGAALALTFAGVRNVPLILMAVVLALAAPAGRKEWKHGIS